MLTTTASDPLPAPPSSPGRTRPRGAAVREHTSAYSVLLADVRGRGLMDRRRGWYVVYASVLLGSLAALGTAFVLLGDSWLQLLVAAGLGVVLAQFGFLGHDAAHRQVFASSQANVWSSRIISTSIIGLSHGWWVHKHSRHHNSPNQPGKDPDIAPGALAFTADVVASRRTGVGRWLTRRQGWLFPPLLLLAGLSLHIAGIRTLIERRDLEHRRLEAVLLTLRLGGYLAVLALRLPTGLAVAFLAVQLAVFGVLLGGSFAPNHKGMPLVPKGSRLDFVQRQVLMSRNIRGGPVVEAAMGGLNLQIEHHLFPSMARPNLRRVKPVVEAFCRERGIPYTETGLLASYAIVVRHLNTVGLGDRDVFVCPLASDLRGS